MEPIILKDKLSYQEGAVVSRELMRTPAGTITLFAFDKNQGLSEHQNPFEAFLEVVEGEAEITVDKVPYKITAGVAINLPANHPHAVKAVTAFKMLLTMLKSG